MNYQEVSEYSNTDSNKDHSDTKPSPLKIKGLLDDIKTLLNTSTGTILASSVGIAIGASFKDLIASFITDIIQPLCVQLFLVTRLNLIFYTLEQSFHLEKNTINWGTFISSLTSFLLLCLLLYQVFAMIKYL